MAIYTLTMREVKRDIARTLGALIHAGTADSGGSGTFTHNELKRFTKDDALNGMQADLVGGTGAGEAQYVSDFTASSGKTDVHVAFASNPDSTTQYHIYNAAIVTKELLEELIKEAVASISRWRLVSTVNRRLILNDLLNGEGDMETYTTANVPDNWTLDGNSTWTEETTAAKVREGSSSLKVVTDGTNLGTATYSIEPHYRFDTQSLIAKAWVWTATASRVEVLYDEGTEAKSSQHGGDSKWELLESSATQVDDPSKLDLICRVTAGSAVTAYFDHARLITATDMWEYKLPSTTLEAISRIFVESGTEGRYRYIEIPPHLYSIDRTNARLIIDRRKFPGYSDRHLHIEGLSSLTVPTADTSTIEVPEYVKAYVQYELLAGRKGTTEQQLGFAKRRRDEEYARARRLPLSKNLKWVER